MAVPALAPEEGGDLDNELDDVRVTLSCFLIMFKYHPKLCIGKSPISLILVYRMD